MRFKKEREKPDFAIQIWMLQYGNWIQLSILVSIQNGGRMEAVELQKSGVALGQ